MLLGVQVLLDGQCCIHCLGTFWEKTWPRTVAHPVPAATANFAQIHSSKTSYLVASVSTPQSRPVLLKCTCSPISLEPSVSPTHLISFISTLCCCTQRALWQVLTHALCLLKQPQIPRSLSLPDHTSRALWAIEPQA